jgi:hypothetical protein
MKTILRALRYVAFAALGGCMLAPNDNQQISVKDELVHFAGYTLEPLAPISIQALNRQTNTWVQIATAITGTAAARDNQGADWYDFQADVRLPSNHVYWQRSQNRLLIQVRAATRDVLLASFAVGSNECVEQAYNSGGPSAVINQCKSPRSPAAELWLDCGQNGQPCCSSNGAAQTQLCAAGLACSAERCTPCGALNQVCCPNNACSNAGLICSGGVCADRLEQGHTLESSPQACASDSTVKKVIDVVEANMPTIDANSSSSCSVLEKEITLGSRMNRAHPEFTNWTNDSYHLGGEGELVANQVLCLLRDLERSPNRSVTIPGPSADTLFGSLGVEQRVGFLNYTPAQRAVDGYQSTRVCLPLVGCFDAQQQKWSARVVETVAPMNAVPIDRMYALRTRLEQAGYHYDLSLGPFPVMTPIGPVTITPSASLDSKMEGYHGAYLLPPFGSLTRHKPVLTNLAPVPLFDMHGRTGLPLVMAARAPVGVARTPHGWYSDLVFGGRSGNPTTRLWNTNSTDIIPDLDVAIPRSAEENTPTTHFHVQAAIRYDMTALANRLIPSGSPVRIDELGVTITPQLDAYYASQVQLAVEEFSRENLEFRGMHQTSSALQGGSSASARVGVGAVVRLKISFVFASKTFELSAEYRPTIPIGSPGVRTAGGWADGDFLRSNGQITTMRGTMFDQGTINTCLAAPQAPGTIPPPTFTPDPDPGIDAPAPCNICVDYRDQANVQRFERILPVGTPNWRCDATRIGCMDMCEVNQTTGALTRIKVSALGMGGRCGIPVPG